MTVTRIGPFSFVVSPPTTESRRYWVNVYAMQDGTRRFGQPWSSRRVSDKMVGNEALWDYDRVPMEWSPQRDRLAYRIALRLNERAW